MAGLTAAAAVETTEAAAVEPTNAAAAKEETTFKKQNQKKPQQKKLQQQEEQVFSLYITVRSGRKTVPSLTSDMRKKTVSVLAQFCCHNGPNQHIYSPYTS